MAEIQLYTPMPGFQLSFSMIQPQNPNCLVGPQILNIMVGPQLQLSAENPTVCLHGPKSTFNWLFQNLQILRTIASTHDVIYTPALFPIWFVIVISFACVRA